MSQITLRQSLNDLIRTDRPESPTELIFIFGSLVMLALQVYATQTGKTIPGFEAMLLALGTYKGVKVAGDWQRAKGAASADTRTSQS